MSERLPTWLAPAPLERLFPACARCGRKLGRRSLVYEVLELADHPLVGWHRPGSPDHCAADRLRRRLIEGPLSIVQRSHLLQAITRRGPGRVAWERPKAQAAPETPYQDGRE